MEAYCEAQRDSTCVEWPFAALWPFVRRVALCHLSDTLREDRPKTRFQVVGASQSYSSWTAGSSVVPDGLSMPCMGHSSQATSRKRALRPGTSRSSAPATSL